MHEIRHHPHQLTNNHTHYYAIYSVDFVFTPQIILKEYLNPSKRHLCRNRFFRHVICIAWSKIFFVYRVSGRMKKVKFFFAIAGVLISAHAYAGEANTMPRNQKFISLQAARNMVHAKHQMPITPPRFIAMRQNTRMLPLKRAGVLPLTPVQKVAASPSSRSVTASVATAPAQDTRSQQLLSLFPAAD